MKIYVQVDRWQLKKSEQSMTSGIKVNEADKEAMGGHENSYGFITVIVPLFNQAY